MKLRRLNENGLLQFADYLNALKETPALTPPRELLADEATSEEVAAVEVVTQVFSSRLEVGRWLNELIEQANLTNPANDKGLWAWLSLLLFDTVCPSDSRGQRKPGRIWRHISDANNYQVYYRHLLNGAWRIFRYYKDRVDSALALLCQPVDRPGDIVEQICANQELVTNRAIVGAATTLYVDPRTKRAKPGTQTKKGGGARRFTAFFNQLDVTWDLYAMEVEDLLEKLPKEFNRFRGN